MRDYQSANTNEYLKEVLEKTFKEETMGSLYRRRGIGLCIPALKLVNCGPKIFKMPHSSKSDLEDDIDDKRKITDVCLATSAMPIVLPIASLLEPNTKNTRGHFIDGGLWANNPTLIGLIEALELLKKKQDQKQDQKQKIEIVSIGTSPPVCGEPLNEDNLNRGIIDWGFGRDIVELSGKAQSLSVNNTCQSLEAILKYLEQPVQICRLSSHLSSKQDKIIGLDQTTEAACNTLRNLGLQKGKEIHQDWFGESGEKKEHWQMLDSIFSTLENLPEKKEN